MITITEISVPAESFTLGQLFTAEPDIVIELERLVPLREDEIIPQLRISGADSDAITRILDEASAVEKVETLIDIDGRILCELRWNSSINGLLQALLDADARILAARGSAEKWEFQLQFKNHGDLAIFRNGIRKNDIPLTLRSITNPTAIENEELLTAEQSDALITAFDEGYFEIPRDIEQAELAVLLGISGNSLAEAPPRDSETHRSSIRSR
ncbi:bacterio-opsin activator domain-containing protein [Halomarina pelagica]|uniref:helix-turn-helix domain-containing protein n=1 Tax=Halomarina pelagica TaxID=2961599 RepID=UPI0020C3BF9B|nr:helix-turn-helix domain-containing protein [Halomarina sp. BND7]